MANFTLEWNRKELEYSAQKFQKKGENHSKSMNIFISTQMYVCSYLQSI